MKPWEKDLHAFVESLDRKKTHSSASASGGRNQEGEEGEGGESRFESHQPVQEREPKQERGLFYRELNPRERAVYDMCRKGPQQRIPLSHPKFKSMDIDVTTMPTRDSGKLIAFVSPSGYSSDVKMLNEAQAICRECLACSGVWSANDDSGEPFRDFDALYAIFSNGLCKPNLSKAISL